MSARSALFGLIVGFFGLSAAMLLTTPVDRTSTLETGLGPSVETSSL